MGRRAGFALAAALLAIILIAAILASLFFAVNEETRTGSASGRADRALAAAESAIEIGLRQLEVERADSLAIGKVGSKTVEVDGSTVALHTTRLDSSLFWMVAVAGDARDPVAASRRIGVLLQASAVSAGSIRIVPIPERWWSELF
jgi:Tfp pilus assembly protein PilX